MRPVQVCGAIVLILLSVTLFLILLSSDPEIVIPGPVLGSWRLPKTKHGLVFDLTEARIRGALYPPVEDNFQVEGFTFYGRLPRRVKTFTKNFRPKNAWLLLGNNSTGIITLLEVQREQPVCQPVVVVVKYFTSWNFAVEASVTVIGRAINRETNDIVEESEILPDISAGFSIGDGTKSSTNGYCQKLIYFGPVDEVRVIGTIKDSDTALILISNIRVVVGPSALDQGPDLICYK